MDGTVSGALLTWMPFRNARATKVVAGVPLIAVVTVPPIATLSVGSSDRLGGRERHRK